jgi:hypothetical protein
MKTRSPAADAMKRPSESEASLSGPQRLPHHRLKSRSRDRDRARLDARARPRLSHASRGRPCDDIALHPGARVM